MSKELLISRTLNEWRAVLMENGEIIDYLMDRLDGSEQEKPRVGDIYKGKVLRVLPGMQSAFVDIGWQKAAFLYVDDAYLPSLEEQREASEKFKEVQKQMEEEKVGEVIPDELSTLSETMEMRFKASVPIESFFKEGEKLSFKYLRSQFPQKAQE